MRNELLLIVSLIVLYGSVLLFYRDRKSVV